MTSVLGRRDPKPRGFSEDVRRETPRACTFHISAKLKKTMRGNHPLLWSVFFSGPVPADERGWSQRRRRRRKFRLLCKTHVFDCQTRDLSADVSEFHETFRKRALTVMHVAVSLGGVKLDGLQEVALGLGLLPLGLNTVSLLFFAPLKKTHERARIPSGTANVPLHGPTLTIMIIIENPHQQAWNTVLVCAGLGVRCRGWHRPTSRGRVLVHY